MGHPKCTITGKSYIILQRYVTHGTMPGTDLCAYPRILPLALLYYTRVVFHRVQQNSTHNCSKNSYKERSKCLLKVIFILKEVSEVSFTALTLLKPFIFVNKDFGPGLRVVANKCYFNDALLNWFTMNWNITRFIGFWNKLGVLRGKVKEELLPREQFQFVVEIRPEIAHKAFFVLDRSNWPRWVHKISKIEENVTIPNFGP